MTGRFTSLSCLLTVGAIALSTAVGCGLHRNTPMTDPADPASTAPSAAPSATSSVKPSAAPSTGPSPVNPPAPPVQGDLSAKVQQVTTSGLMWARTLIATVQVSNPANGALSGTLTCTFGSGSSSDATQTKQVTLMANEVRTYTFEYKSWFTSASSVKATITTNHQTAPQQSTTYPHY
jgi:hypothetical protein